ncbi:MAG: GerMN domain-containing protein [Hespellia sp.]|nr:GerMN domain-containing protein [Hespellia sp.]
MRKKLEMAVVIAALVVGGVACGSETSSKEGSAASGSGIAVAEKDEQETGGEKQEEIADSSVKEENSEKNDLEQEPEQDSPESEEKKVTLYYSNANADGFDTEEVTIPELTPAALVKKLSEKSSALTNVSVLSFSESQSADAKVIDLDLSVEFSNGLKNQGSAGEYITMGSLCNTFLSAYECDKIRVTVEGQILETGHAEYPGYMVKFN